MRIPNRQECYRIMHAMKMMDHIVAHSLQVCRVALLLSDSLDASLNRDLIQAAALLHDITKTRGIQTHENHAETGEDLLIDLGYPEVGIIVGQHVLLDKYFAATLPTEAEVVNYADKRVVHDAVTTLARRMAYIMERYGTEPDRRTHIQALGEKTKDLENHIFHSCPFSPEEVALRLGSDTCAAEFSEYKLITSVKRSTTMSRNVVEEKGGALTSLTKQD